MLTVTIQGKEFLLCDTWSDLTLSKFGELCSLKMPDKLKAKYRAMIDGEEQKPDNHRDLVKTYPKYYGEVIKLLSDIPQDVIDSIEWSVYRDWETDRKSTRLNSSH